jgi:hypothetical protein
MREHKTTKKIAHKPFKQYFHSISNNSPANVRGRKEKREKNGQAQNYVQRNVNNYRWKIEGTFHALPPSPNKKMENKSVTFPPAFKLEQPFRIQNGNKMRP